MSGVGNGGGPDARGLHLNGMKRMLQYTLARARRGPLDPLARRSYL